MSAPAILAMSAKTMMAASLGVSAITTVANYAAQSANAEAQIEAQQTNLNNTRRAAGADLIAKSTDLQQRELQERESTALRVHNAKLKARQAAGTAEAAGTSSGLSFDALLADYDRQYSNYADAQFTQLGFTVDQIDRSREAIEAEANGRINSVPLTPVTRPSLGLAVAEFGAGALNTYDKFSVVDPLTGQRTLT